MAKIGNFVGQGWMAIGKREAKQIEKYLTEQCREVFGADYFDRFEAVVDNKAWDYSTTGKRYAHVRCMRVYGYVKHPIPEFRNNDGSRIKGHTRVEFCVIKHKGGWLDIKGPNGEYTGERDYENCPPFDYSCRVKGDGHEYVYGGTHPNVIEPRDHYVYGTEITDLDERVALRNLRRMTEVAQVPKQYHTEWMARKAV